MKKVSAKFLLLLLILSATTICLLQIKRTLANGKAGLAITDTEAQIPSAQRRASFPVVVDTRNGSRIALDNDSSATQTKIAVEPQSEEDTAGAYSPETVPPAPEGAVEKTITDPLATEFARGDAPQETNDTVNPAKEITTDGVSPSVSATVAVKSAISTKNLLDQNSADLTEQGKSQIDNDAEHPPVNTVVAKGSISVADALSDTADREIGNETTPKTVATDITPVVDGNSQAIAEENIETIAVQKQGGFRIAANSTTDNLITGDNSSVDTEPVVAPAGDNNRNNRGVLLRPDDPYMQAYLQKAIQRDSAPMVINGPGASVMEGDDDYLQVIFFLIPQTHPTPLYLRLFDPECSGLNDTIYGVADTQTRFTLYGGEGAYSAPTVKQLHPTMEDLAAGSLIETATFAGEEAYDNGWFNFAKIDPDAGELVGTYRVFRLVVQGVAGNDGNVFDLVLSMSDMNNLPPWGARIQNYMPAISLSVKGAAELRFRIPAGTERVTVGSFDVAHATVTLDTMFEHYRLKSSGQGSFNETAVDLYPSESERRAAIYLHDDGFETPNYAVFYVTGENGEPLPIEHPVTAGPRNQRPHPVIHAEPLADCSAVAFDASGTVDPDGDSFLVEWHFGDGQYAQGTKVVHRYKQPGTYTAQARIEDDSGWVADGTIHSFPVRVNHPPSAIFEVAPVAAPRMALAFDASASEDPDDTELTYTWEFGDGSAGQGRQTTHIYQHPGRYRATLRVQDPATTPCNWAETHSQVWVNAAPVAEAGEHVICAVGENIVLDGGRSYDVDGEVIRFHWDLGDGNRAESERISYRYSEPGRYQVQLTVEDDAGVPNSASTDETTIIVNYPPVALAGPDRKLAAGELTQFDAAGSSDTDGRITRYYWDFGDGGTGNGPQVAYAYSRPGTYTVTLRVEDDQSQAAGSATDTLTVFVNAAPQAVTPGNRLITGSEININGTASTDSDGEITAYGWDFGDGSTGQGADPNHVYASPGVYRVRLTVTDNSGTESRENRTFMTVLVNERPTADAGPDPAPLAIAETVEFSAAESFDPDGQIVAYEWDFGDGQRATGRTVEHAYAQAGTYRAQLKVVDNSGTPQAIDFDEVRVQVNHPPVAKAGPDLQIAPDQDARFDGSSSYDPDGELSGYSWQFSDTSEIAPTSFAERRFSESGIYTATLTVTDDSGAANGTAQDEVSVHVNHSPQAIPGPDIVTCDTKITFDGSASVDVDRHTLDYHWDFGDGHQARGQSVSRIFTAGGVYPVTLTVDDGTGLSNARHSATQTVTINRPPEAVAGANVTTCAGKAVILDGSGSSDPDGGVLSYHWKFEDGTSSDLANPTKVFSKGGIYRAVLTVSDESGLTCNQDTDALSIRVVESPVANAGPDLTECTHNPVRFDGTASKDVDGVVDRYYWDFGDGNSGEGPSPEHIFREPGTYHVRLTVTGEARGECDNTDSDDLTVEVRPAPVAVIDSEDIVAAGEETHFSACDSKSGDTAITAWEWDFGDGYTAAGQDVTHTYGAYGKYTVTLRLTTAAEDACRLVSSQKVVTVNQAPVPEGGTDRLVGVNEPVVFSADRSRDDDGGIIAYEWDFGDGEHASGVQVRHRYRSSGQFRVKLSVEDDAGVSNSRVSKTILVTVNDAPQAVIRVPEHGCAGRPLTFDATGSSDTDGRIVSYQWLFGDGQQTTGDIVNHTYAEPGRYSVTLIVTDDSGVLNSVKQAVVLLPVNRPPRAQAGPDRRVCPGQTIYFDGGASIDPDGRLSAYNWIFGDGAAAQGQSVTHTYDTPGTYHLQLKVSDETETGCGVHEDKAKILVNASPVANAGEDRGGYTGGAHDAILFDGSISYSPAGWALDYQWDFGDGNIKTGSRVFHYYSDPGSYTVRLTVSDPTGLPCGEAYDEITVVIGERQP